MKLWAIADLHLRYEENRLALDALAPRPDDWLIIAGDVGEKEAELRWALDRLAPRFAQLLWVPGNHDLWTPPSEKTGLAGEAKYLRLVEICRQRGVLTPEDSYPVWPGERSADGLPIRIAPLFLLYDYTFRPDHVAAEDAVSWAIEQDVLCSDEMLLKPAPHASRQAWCHQRVAATAPRLAEATAAGERLILVNHFPLRRDHAVLPRVPRFSIWCGTRLTEDWHLRFNADAVVFGHLHIPQSFEFEGVRFEEVSFGYPRNWRNRRDLESSLRQILPSPLPPRTKA